MDKLTRVVKMMGWQHLRVVKPGEPEPEELALRAAEEERLRREREEQERALAHRMAEVP